MIYEIFDSAAFTLLWGNKWLILQCFLPKSSAKPTDCVFLSHNSLEEFAQSPECSVSYDFFYFCLKLVILFLMLSDIQTMVIK